MINIKSKSEIIIPFEQIGDENWIDKTQYIIHEFANNWGEELSTPISMQAISELEKRLGVSLPIELTLFYQNFGISNIGEELQHFDEMDWFKNIMEEDSEYGPYFSDEDKKLFPFLITFSDCLGSGNMFCFHSETKEVYYYDHDTQPYLTKLFDTVSDYIKGCLISCQVDLFHQKIGQEQVEKWCEEILNEMFGKHSIEKWKY